MKPVCVSMMLFAPLQALIAAIPTTTAVPTPLSIAPSQAWDGNDGYWSSFPLRIGTPPQNVRVLVSTAATSSWVVSAQYGCRGYSLYGCADARGGLFKSNASSSLVTKGFYHTKVESNLGIDVQAQVGFDTVGLGRQGTGEPTLLNTTVTEFADVSFLVGMFGVNPRPTNFSDFNDRATSYLSLLFEKNEIPSLSFSYTAGAKYMNNGTLASLVLGGYDEGLSEPNGLSFPFHFDDTRDLSVRLQAITSKEESIRTSLLPKEILILIDSTVTQIWLPIEACRIFEATFGLVFDDTTGYYFLDGKQHANLLSRKPSITFTLSQGYEAGKTVNITFPYAAFDLNISYPAVPNNMFYFPLRQAANETQFTLGRVFLQEAYLTVDYGRSNFSISQRNWDIEQKSHIVSIMPPSNGSMSDVPDSVSKPAEKDAGKSGVTSALSKGARAGIGIAAAVVIVLVVVVGVYLYLRRWKIQRININSELISGAPDSKEDFSGIPQELSAVERRPPELSGQPSSRQEVDGEDTQVTPREFHGQHSFNELNRAHTRQHRSSDALLYELETPI